MRPAARVSWNTRTSASESVAPLRPIMSRSPTSSAMGFPLTVNGTGKAPAQSVNFTLDGIAYRTFSAPVEHLRRATLTTFKRMEITLKSDKIKEDGCRAMVAAAGDRMVYVELEQI